MKIEVKEIRIVRGEFSILPPEEEVSKETAEIDSKPKTSKLTVGCEFALINSEGDRVASGGISNVPNAMGQTVKLSEETLSEFGKFFRSLEHDVANSLSSMGEPVDALDDILVRAQAG